MSATTGLEHAQAQHSVSSNGGSGPCEPYVEFHAGGIITAQAMNDVQCEIRADIAKQSQTAVDNIDIVPRAEDADALEGQSVADLTRAIIDQALSQIATRSGYMRVFKLLQVGKEAVVEHNLKNFPLVDLYQLDYFKVVAAEDDDKYVTWVNFYLYHSSEKRIRHEEGGTTERVDIEPSGMQAYRIPFKEMLDWYKVEYNNDSSVGDLETEFWDALFSDPNDQFHDDQYTKSPWFDRCCREERTVKSLKQKGDWDELWLKVVPRKTVNFPIPDVVEGEPPEPPTPAPTHIQVTHFDHNRLGLTLLQDPVYPKDVVDALNVLRPEALQELKVMALLRV